MKKNFFQKFNTYSFWVSLSSAMLILIQAIGTPAGLTISEDVYMSVVNSVLGVFVLLGIVPKKSSTDDSFQTTNDDEASDTASQDTAETYQADLNLDENERELLISYQRTNQIKGE